MLEVTDRAIDQLAQMRTAAGLDPDQGLGIVPQGDGGMQLAALKPGPTDQVVMHADVPVMVVPAVLADQLDGLVLDVRPGVGEAQFTLTRADDSDEGGLATANAGN